MAGRALAFADAELIKLASKTFVPVAGDDWYQRRRQDDEGEFFRKVADQGPRKGAGGGTRQGIYCLTASGKLLAYKNALDASVMLDTLRQALRRWNALPAAERKPAALELPGPGNVDRDFARTPPEGGLILKCYTRILDRDDKGRYTRGTCKFSGGDRAARDHVWLTKSEWQSLLPTEPRAGERFATPAGIARRLLRFHLADNTRGEPDFWAPEDVRQSDLTWTVREVSDGAVELGLTGTALLATAADPKSAPRGYDVALAGRLRYDRAKKAITQLDIVAVGEHWGEGTYTKGARPGRTPLGVSFELCPGTEPADRVTPQAAREVGAYLAAR
ncbi:MAG: hypothetical protein U0797_13170 [Gemmataceae bacterium]